MRKMWCFCFALMVCLGLFVGYGQAADGDLDDSFGVGGKVITNCGTLCGGIGSVAIQADGKIVVVSSNALFRYNSNGSLDTSFGSSGKVTTGENFKKLALQTDGKIVVAGTNSLIHISVARYNSDGSLDTSFGTGGKVTTSIRSSDSANALAVQTDGKIVVAGETNDSSSSSDIAVVRYNSNGSLDTSFGIGGKVTTSIRSSNYADALAVQTDGKIVVTGITFDSSSSSDIAMVRYNSNGGLDTSFGTGGKVTTSIRSFDFAEAIAIQSDGKIVVAGYTGDSLSSGGYAVVRYNGNGGLDTSFGTGGIVTTSIGGKYESASDLAIQTDGKIVVAGKTGDSISSGVIAVVRYNGNGGLDTSFGTGGKVTTSIVGSKYESASDLAIQTDGKIVVAGSTGDTLSSLNIAVVRYKNNSSILDSVVDSLDGDGGGGCFINSIHH